LRLVLTGYQVVDGCNPTTPGGCTLRFGGSRGLPAKRFPAVGIYPQCCTSRRRRLGSSWIPEVLKSRFQVRAAWRVAAESACEKAKRSEFGLPPLLAAMF